MECRECGKKLKRKQTICPKCKTTIPSDQSQIDQGSMGYFFLGLLVPLAGVIIYFRERYRRPKDAKMVLIGTVLFFPIFFSLLYLPMILESTVPIVENTQKSAIYADALQVEQTVNLYCHEFCDLNQEVTYGEIKDGLTGFDQTMYELSNDTVIANYSTEGTKVYLERVGTGEYEFEQGYIPSETDRESVNKDTN